MALDEQDEVHEDNIINLDLVYDGYYEDIGLNMLFDRPHIIFL